MGAQLGHCATAGIGPCLAALLRERAGLGQGPAAPSQEKPARQIRQTCGGCGESVEEFAKGAGGTPLCRACLRSEDEALLGPFAPEERSGLDLTSCVLDTVPWSYWKPGEQPAEILEWLYLGDLEEAMDAGLLKRKGIGAVLNLINWWELTARRPDVDLPEFYASHDIAFQEADSEDRLFFDIVDKCWPEAEEFLDRWRQEGLKVLVNCKAGHNRSACICVCWLLVREKMSLVEAIERVQRRRGTILSNHGFRLQLVRLALLLGRLGETSRTPKSPGLVPTPESPSSLVDVALPPSSTDDIVPRPQLGKIIMKKRLSVKYDTNSKDFTCRTSSIPSRPSIRVLRGRSESVISEKVDGLVSQRTLSMELLACLIHWNKNFKCDYEYTRSPPVVVGSGFSGDVLLCRRKGTSAERCVKRFDLQQMPPDKLEKLKNEAVIYLSLEHPHIARLFDVYEDPDEVSLVMQYCSGGTLEDKLRKSGAYGEAEFQDVGAQMLRAVSYIHRVGIVHRDIKPRNFVYERDRATIKLIDFGFSVKGYLAGSSSGLGLQGCMGTLGYLAPEVVHAGASTDAAYTEKCDIWSLGVVFYEILAGQPAFHRDRGMCDGYTEECVLREIEDVTEDGIAGLLQDVPEGSRAFLRRLLTKDVAARPSARGMLDDAYLAAARGVHLWPPEALPVAEVLKRFSAHGHASKPTRAWLLAKARSPTDLPWKDFCALRDTFKMFDAIQLTGTVNLEAFLSVITCSDDGNCEDAKAIWQAVCGEHESLSYCEFLAALLPTTEDVFEDVSTTMNRQPSEGSDFDSSPFSLSKNGQLGHWNPSLPVADFLPLLHRGKQTNQAAIFGEEVQVLDVVRAMSDLHYRWVIVRYRSGQCAFFDYMDINHKLVNMTARAAGSIKLSEAMARVSSMAVGSLADCSNHSLFVPVAAGTPLCDVLRLITRDSSSQSGAPVRRVPIVDARGEVLHVFSCLDFLHLALRFTEPTAVLKSRAARTFDRRDTMLEVSVQSDEAVSDALRIMASSHLTICPATSRELSGDLGGVVSMNVISVADLKWVLSLGQFAVLDGSVSDFIEWRASIVSDNLGKMLRQQRLCRFNVVSVDKDDSLHVLAHRLLASKLQRIFLSSEELCRIVGIVSSRDILAEVLDQLL